MTKYWLIAVLGLSGCSAGPQVIPTTPVVSIAVTVQATDGGTLSGVEVWIDGTSSEAKPVTHGIESHAEATTDAVIEVPTAGGEQTAAP